MTQNQRSSSILTGLAFALVLLFGGSATAETLMGRTPSVAAVAIEIGGEGAVTPLLLTIADGDRFRVVNTGASSTRIVFDRKSAGAVDCELSGASRARLGQFVLTREASIRCAPSARKLSYTVYSQKSGGGVVKTKGRIAVER